MLARSALARLAADVPKTSTHDLSRSARLVQRRLFSRNALSLPSSPACSRVYRAALLESHRSYATAADATKATPKVKRDVKKAVAKKPAAKKPAAKKAAPKKKPVKKAAAAKKPKKAAKPKKELTPEKQQEAQEKKEKLLIKAFKERALESPTTPTKRHAWHIVTAEALTSARDDSTQGKTLKEAAAKFQTLTPAEKEHYNHLANEMNAAKEAELTAWIRSHTPEEIRLANKARSWLRRKLTSAVARRKYFKLPDDRHLKRPLNSFVRFVKERGASGDMKGIRGKDVIKLCTDEWKTLSASEKQKFKDEYDAEMVVYKTEFEQLYGHAPDEGVRSPRV